MGRSVLFALAPALAIACAPSSPARSVLASHDPPAPQPVASSAASVSPGEPMTIAQARAYMLDLINADRRSMGLPPVALDDGPAQRAAQQHAEEMASFGYLGHWGLDGSVPESRMTEAGDSDIVLENASCFTDLRSRVLDRDARVDPAEIARTQSMFFHETPPNDGHRKNILKPWHTKVAIGIAQPRKTPTEIPVPCFAQEFVDDYGTYAPIPKAARVGDKLHVEGIVRAPAKVAGVGLARSDAPRALSPGDANARRSYAVPPPYEMFWTPGYQTRIPLRVKGERFAIDVPLDDAHKPGTYELSIWAKVPGTEDFTIVSLRTIRVEPPEP